MKAQRKPLSPPVRKACELYFGCKVGDQGKSLGSKNLLRLMFEDIDRLVKRYAQVDAFCCPDGVA
jgi:hypothetical protein